MLNVNTVSKNMDPNVPKSDASLLLKLPKSVLTFSDMSGNSFLMPVAVENVVDSEIILQGNLSSEKQKEPPKIAESSSVCQLQQPLLMRRGSSPKMAVPYSESSVPSTSADSGQTGVSHSKPHMQPPVSTIGISNQPEESLLWPRSSVAGPPSQSSAIFSSFQTQPPTIQPEVNQPRSSLPQSLNQESRNLGYQSVYSQESSVPSSSNFPSNPVMAPNYPGFSEKTNDYQTTSTTADYFSQPPVITPSNVPACSRRYESQVPCSTYPNMPHQNVQNPNTVDSDRCTYRASYCPATPYWLYKDVIENREIWHTFNLEDSEKLEMAFLQDPQSIVPVDGGRYDAYLNERIKKPVYFEAKNLQIRRCTWYFQSDISQRFIPFPEEAANLIEQQYCRCLSSAQWQKRIDIPGVGSVVLETPFVYVYYKNEVELWPSLPGSKASPRCVRRGLPNNFEIQHSESDRIDHLVFVVQGIGSFCDLRFRTVTECVDGLRDLANKMIGTHYTQDVLSGRIGRVEFLPVAWHAKLHTSDQGFDRCMQNITLPSIPKLRHFTNDTLLDILLYSSPTYCQTILDTVASDLNKLYELFMKRNPEFSGKVFVAGHSLGSLILFDILSHQTLDKGRKAKKKELNPDKESKFGLESEGDKVASEDIKENIEETYDSIAALLQACQLEEYTELFEKEKIDLSSVGYLSNDDLKDLGVPTGPRKKLLNTIRSNKANLPQSDDELPFGLFGQDSNTSSSSDESLVFPMRTSPCMATISYPKLQFEPACLFALGSPIAMFLTVRGYESISEDFRFPTCPNFFHIFHPYDPVAYRIEPLIDPSFTVKPVLIPHHKGRKRMHLEIRENLSKVGSEIKQKVLETLRYTWNSLSGFAKAHTFPSAAVEAEVDKLVIQQMSETEYEHQAPSSEPSGEDLEIGSLNGGRRIDYVLQEKPIEALNDYVFALTSHSTYWNSEDTVLMILREIYATQGILVSSQSQYSNSELPSYEAYSQLSSVMSNPSLYESSKLEQAPTNVLSFFNESVPSEMPSCSQSLQNFNSYVAATSHVTSNVPPPCTTQQLMEPSLTTTQQLVGPPLMTTQQAVGHPLIATQQAMGHSLAATQQATGSPFTATQQVTGSSLTATQQVTGPPPLTGFVKRSPFSR